MKHSKKITIILLTIFIFTQYFGLSVVNNYIDEPSSLEAGETIFEELPFFERPDIAEETSFLPIIVVIILGTIILLLLIKFKAFLIWKLWFLMAVIMTTLVSLNAYLGKYVALVLAILLAIWKIFKPNPIIHNITEIFVYAGLAAVFVTIFNLKSISILLVLISLYDMYAVWKSKHMITLANAQSDAQLFAGLLIPYRLKKKKGKKRIKVKTAMLGGGDIGFSLLFAAVILKEYGLIASLIIPLFTTMALALLFYYSDDKKFYPAMPPVTIACFLGLLMIKILGLA